MRQRTINEFFRPRSATAPNPAQEEARSDSTHPTVNNLIQRGIDESCRSLSSVLGNEYIDVDALQDNTTPSPLDNPALSMSCDPRTSIPPSENVTMASEAHHPSKGNSQTKPVVSGGRLGMFRPAPLCVDALHESSPDAPIKNASRATTEDSGSSDDENTTTTSTSNVNADDEGDTCGSTKSTSDESTSTNLSGFIVGDDETVTEHSSSSYVGGLLPLVNKKRRRGDDDDPSTTTSSTRESD